MDDQRRSNYHVSYETVNSSNSNINIIVIVIFQTELILVTLMISHDT